MRMLIDVASASLVVGMKVSLLSVTSIIWTFTIGHRGPPLVYVRRTRAVMPVEGVAVTQAYCVPPLVRGHHPQV